ncbi:MAG: hypothetical protein IKW59_03685 [Clostridia bacterium]|nr:hypothetical protein [Clostridia bacterium]
MKKCFSLFIIFILTITVTGVSALKYKPPYDEVDGGRAEQNMPSVFSINTVPRLLVAETDFNEGANSATLTKTTGAKDWYSVEDGALKIVKAQTNSAHSVVMLYKPKEGIVAGDTYAFSCKIKTVGVEGGAARNLIAAYNSTSNWLAETHDYDGKSDYLGDNDWYDMIQTIVAPEGTAFFNLTAYLQKGMTGTVYFDDFKLYRIGIDPLESVLCSPNYKGLIYGDGYGDIDLDAQITEQAGFYDLENMELSVSLIDENNTVYRSSNAKTLSNRMNFVFSSAGLNEGDYYLQTVLKDKQSGEIISEKEHTIRKRAEDYRPAVYLDENGHLIKNGEKTFFKRLYNYKSNLYQEVAEKAVEAGVDTVSNYGMWWDLDTEPAAFNYMRENGITTHICLSTYWFSNLSGNQGDKLIKKQTDILPFLTRLANEYKNDPVLEGYYVFDEPDPITEGEEIRWNNEILAQTDINHPTFGVADGGYSYYGIYNKMADVLGIDPYPAIKDEVTDDLAKVGRSMRTIKKNFPNRPVYIVLEGFHYDERGDVRSPNGEELRNMAWQAICEGAEGIDWYAYPDMKNDTTKDFDTWWSEFKTIYNEIDGYKNIILSDEPAPVYQVTGSGDWLNLRIARYNGKTYLFAVNNTKTKQAATVAISGGGTHSLSFEPLEVIIKEISQSEYLSPLAELKTIGFYNGTEAFAVSEAEENILYVPENAGVINYAAKISENAKLYIGGVEVSEKGKITVKNVDSFTVSVVAENGVTEHSKVYRVVK